MPWATFLLFLIGGYVATVLFKLANKRERLKYFGLMISACLFTLIELSLVLEAVINSSIFRTSADFFIEWGHITAIAFILSSLAIFIRESKPVVAQFPLFYTALPLLIVLSYLLVHNTYALKRWLLAIYQGGAIIVGLLMYSIYSYRRQQYTLILVGITVLLFSYIAYWYVPVIQESYNWFWKLLLGIGLIITARGYKNVEEQQKIEIEPTVTPSN